MKLLSYPDILDGFKYNVEHSVKIDMAIAWVTRSYGLDLLEASFNSNALKKNTRTCGC